MGAAFSLIRVWVLPAVWLLVHSLGKQRPATLAGSPSYCLLILCLVPLSTQSKRCKDRNKLTLVLIRVFLVEKLWNLEFVCETLWFLLSVPHVWFSSFLPLSLPSFLLYSSLPFCSAGTEPRNSSILCKWSLPSGTTSVILRYQWQL